MHILWYGKTRFGKGTLFGGGYWWCCSWVMGFDSQSAAADQLVALILMNFRSKFEGSPCEAGRTTCMAKFCRYLQLIPDLPFVSICMYIYICMYVCMYACMHVCMYVYTYVSINAKERGREREKESCIVASNWIQSLPECLVYLVFIGDLQESSQDQGWSRSMPI